MIIIDTNTGVQDAVQVVKDWTEAVKVVKEHLDRYPSPDRELQYENAYKKLKEAKLEVLKALNAWMDEIIKTDINGEIRL